MVRIAGLDRSAVSTLNGWQQGFIDEHVRFGRDTVHKKNIKKDAVDAAVGGYEAMVNTDEPQPLTPNQAAEGATAMAGIARTIDLGFRPTKRGVA
jgi:hypothetical protein